MKKLDRINELVDELNELKFGCMAASLAALYHSVQTATFCGQQGRISRPVRAILSGRL